MPRSQPECVEHAAVSHASSVRRRAARTCETDLAHGDVKPACAPVSGCRRSGAHGHELGACVAQPQFARQRQSEPEAGARAVNGGNEDLRSALDLHRDLRAHSAVSGHHGRQAPPEPPSRARCAALRCAALRCAALHLGKPLLSEQLLRHGVVLRSNARGVLQIESGAEGTAGPADDDHANLKAPRVSGAPRRGQRAWGVTRSQSSKVWNSAIITRLIVLSS
jgi:hypothetical protein